MEAQWASWASRPVSPNEDFVLTSSRFAVLLDGAGVPPGIDTGCLHGVRWFVRRLAFHLVTQAGNELTPLSAALERAVEAATEDHRYTCDVGHPRSPSSTVVAARWDDTTLEWLVLGDSTLLVVDPAGPTAISDDRIAAIPRRVDERHRSWPAGREALKRWTTLIDDERSARNQEAGYWIAADNPAAARHAITGHRNVDEIRELLLASDGATRPVDRFKVHDWRDLVATVNREGPAGWLTVVRGLEKSDPNNERWPRAKTHDDASLAMICQWGQAPGQAAIVGRHSDPGSGHAR